MSTVTTSSVAGIVAGRNPLEYSASHSYTIFLFQAVLIIFFCQLLNYPLKKLQQPRVIAEVLTGIILGPTVMGRIPKFTATCFPTASQAGLTLIANVGIIFFLFIVGLEVDLKYIQKNARVAFSVGFINMAIPFALGCGIAKGLYNEYHNDEGTNSISFTTFMVFIAVALCITAFPVLARILVELNLIGDRVGTIVLSAGIINDLVGWILLALVVTLANADNGIHTLYILLLTIAWFLFLVYPVKMAFSFYLKRYTSELVAGQPSQLLMVIIIAMVFISAFYTDIIGVHPIFGAFMVGVIIPRDNGYVIRITEKLEDLVHVVMIPIYFAVAGLNVDLGELNRGIDWAYVIAVIALAMVGKIAGGYLAAQLNGYLWRDSLAVGVLMSCKGIVEIVVLNVGLNAKIISSRVYSMFIVMALVTTFSTTPLAIWVYPPHARTSTSEWSSRANEHEHETLISSTTSELSLDTLDKFSFSSIILLVRKINSMSNLLLLFKDLESASQACDVKAVHIRDFSSRTSHLLEASSAGNPDSTGNEQEQADSISILAIVKAFSSLLNIRFTTKSIFAPGKNYLNHVNDQVTSSSNFLLTSMAATSLVQSTVENDDLASNYKMLLLECKCHVGVLLATRNASSDEQKVIRVVLNQNDSLSSSDILSLYLAKQLSKTHHDVRIYIRSAGLGRNEGFEKQFRALMKSDGTPVNVEITYFSSFEEVVSSNETLVKSSLANSLFLVTPQFMDSGNESEIVSKGVQEGFEILVVRACT